MAQLFSMLDVLTLVAAILAAMGVIHTPAMSVPERRCAIGRLRRMGMTRWQVVGERLEEEEP